jgi:hypothetical protein
VYRITYILGAKGPALEQHMKTLLACLTMCDRLYLRTQKAIGKPVPLIYKSGVTHEEEYGEQDDWCDIPTTRAMGHGDAEDLACWRAAELQEQGVDAWPTFDHDHGCLHPKVRYADGRLEDPAAIMGQTSHTKPCVGISSSPDQKETRVVFCMKVFHGSKAPQEEQELAHETLRLMLGALTIIDADILRRLPQLPELYDPNMGVFYEIEPAGREDWQDVLTNFRRKSADCVPVSSLVLCDDYELVPIGTLEPGERIMGDGRWTNVVDVLHTGDKPILAFDLNNGSTLRCTPEHRIFLADGTEVRAESVRPGQSLQTIKQIPTSKAWRPDTRLSSEDLAWLTGIHVADGWCHNGSFAISGDDETPKRGKREQKDRIARMMTSIGVITQRAKKYLRVQDKDLNRIMESCGHLAFNKRMPTLALSETQVRAAIEGLSTDASIASKSGSLIHGTTSPLLALQTRVLYRMLGQSVHIRGWKDHGGLGEHPIYRVGVRRHAEEDTSARVVAVREEEPEACCDIETDSGRFYLPECDLVVHNCEDLASHRAAELQVKHGINAWPSFTYRMRPSGAHLYHIQTRYPDGAIEDPSRVLGMGRKILE